MTTPRAINKPEVVIAILLLLACVGVDLAIVVEILTRRTGWPAAAGVVGLGLALGQEALVVAWITWGAWNLLVRLMIGAVALLGLSYLADVSVGGPAVGGDIGKWFGAFLVYAILLAIPLVAVRLMKYRLELTAPNEFKDMMPRLASWQFSIGSLLTAMTATGVIVSVLRLVDFPFEELIEVGLFFTILALASCFVLVYTFISWRPWTALPWIALVSPLAGFLLSLTGLPPEGDWPQLMGASVVSAASIFAPVMVLRSAGFRLRRFDDAASLGHQQT